MMNIAGRADIGDFHYLLEKSFTFNLVAGEGDTHNEMFSIQGNQLIAKTPVNYETGNQFSIRIEVTDSGGLKLQKEFELTAVDAPDAPTDILLSNSTVDENLKKGTVVGNLTALDEDDGEKHTYRVLTSQLSSEISDLFPEQLLVRDGSTVSRDTALAGKIIGIYFGPSGALRARLSLRVSSTSVTPTVRSSRLSLPVRTTQSPINWST